MRNYYHLFKSNIQGMIFYFSLAFFSVTSDTFSTAVLMILVSVHIWINYRSDSYFKKNE